jgi:cyclopropane fatty-acyl-phospholipid synthase-like methyltransferase
MNKETKDFYEFAYQKKNGIEKQWTAGTAGPELVNLVYTKKIKPASKILEVGCGLGTESIFLAVRGMDVTAVDLSSTAIDTGIKIAEQYNVNINWIVGDLLEENLFENEFDVITDQGCFHHMKESEFEKYREKICRYLKSGGLFILRAFSDAMPAGEQPRRVSSDDMLNTFSKDFKLEHMERVLSFSSEKYDMPLGWYSLWVKR